MKTVIYAILLALLVPAHCAGSFASAAVSTDITAPVSDSVQETLNTHSGSPARDDEAGEELNRGSVAAARIISSLQSFDGGNADDDGDSDSDSGIVVAVLVLLGVFFAGPASLVALVWLVLAMRNRARRDRLQYYLTCHERGFNPVGDDGGMLQSDSSAMRSTLSSGVLLVGVGMALALMFWCVAGAEVGVFIGAIPFFVGVARLTTYYLSRK